MNNRGGLFLVLGLVVVILLIIWLTSFKMGSEETADSYSTNPQIFACPMDAKLCPDGTTLSRTGPSCQFPPCPEVDLTEIDLAAELAKCLPRSDQGSRQICQQLMDKIQDFDTCVLAGFPIRETYPEQCVTADGRLFTNQY